MNKKQNRTIQIAAVWILCAACVSAHAASWTKLTNLAPGGASTGTMLLLTDGTIMIQSGGSATWLRLTPDAKGSYINGAWNNNPINPMSTNRLYFASEVLPNGKVWVLGGEYYGPVLNSAWTSTGEEWDPIANTWSPIAAFPPQSCFGVAYNVSGDTTSGSPVITNLPPPVTPTFLPGWSVSGTGIPANSTVTSVDSSSQVHISNNATATQSGAGFTFAGTPASCFGDDPSILLPGGRILTGSLVSNSTYIYNIANNSFKYAASKVYNESSDEEGWTKLANGKVLTYDVSQSINSGSSYAELYDPSANQWSSISPADGSASGTLPMLSSTEVGYELGPGLRLQDGRALLIGANGNTALYTPSTNTWAAGPVIMGSLNGFPAVFGTDDGPGAILPNGHVIFAADAGPAAVISTGNVTAGSNIITGISSTATIQVRWPVSQTSGAQAIPFGAVVQSVDSPTQIHISANATKTATINLQIGGVFSFPTQIFDFNPASNTISPVSPALPDNRLPSSSSYVSRMLMLPNGQLLFSDGSSQLWVYQGDGNAASGYKPVITSVTAGSGGTYTLTGMMLSGQSAGAAYGDDAEMDENYPIVRLVSSNGNIYYCRTTNWSSVGVGPNTVPQTVNFTLNSSAPSGTYGLVVSAAGISSAAFSFTIP